MAGASRTSGASGAGAAGAGGVSVTLLTLDCARQQQQPPPPPPAQSQTRPRSRQFYLNTPRSIEFKDSDRDMNDLKLIRDFQIRRKYGRRHGHVPASSNRENNFIDLGLSGTKYFSNNKNETTTTATTTTNNNDDNKTEGSFTSSLENSRKRKTQPQEDRVSRLQQNGTSITVSPIVARVDEDLGSVDAVIKDLQSPVPSTFPPISPKMVGKVGVGVGVGMKAESSFFTAGRHIGQFPSLLVNHFGFSTIRPDTFTGIRRHHRLNGASNGNDDLIKELEQHAQRQILACQNMGFTHRGSRAAQSVLGLKHTVSPSAFHPSSFFSRHVSREERVSRSGTPGTMGAGVGLGEGEEAGRSRRRAIHPHPAGKLSMPRLLVPDRQDQAASRRATLPTVNGSSLQVVLAHSLTK
ncbi:uncharacterized protein [Littorina saxatilis]|uniref:uncharacterized protein n=1 Tax=Littorina saxatilis TaxID=31220 RepID=UPI0038B44795